MDRLAAGAAKPAATGFFTTIRRGPDGRFAAVPYSVEYQGELALAASLLREAAELTTQPTLKHFLTTRADAFISNDYYASDVAWMELDASIEPTIGPYEVYEDEWFNFKAAFEAFITIRDEAESKQLQVFGSELQGLENALPIDASLRNPKLGALAPIKVVNVVFTAGDGNRGVQTAAFNLPNDERVVKEKGTKRVMLKNVQQAKFKVVLEPIAKVALPEAQQKDVSFDAFFTHILMHELMHGLGPHNIAVGGRQTTVRQELKETYSTIEEAKADVSGLWALKQLADQGKVDKAIARTMYTTFLASSFRSIRFGINEAHGRGIAIQLNYFLDQGAFVVGPDGRFTVDEAKMVAAVTSLTRDIMTLQAEGSYAKAKALIDTLGVVRPPGAADSRSADGSSCGHRAEVHDGGDAGSEIEEVTETTGSTRRRTKTTRRKRDDRLISHAGLAPRSRGGMGSRGRHRRAPSVVGPGRFRPFDLSTYPDRAAARASSRSRRLVSSSLTSILRVEPVDFVALATCASLSTPAQLSTATSGLSLMMLSAPQSRRRRMSSRVSTVQTRTGNSARWAWAMKLGVTTTVAPARSGT